MEPSESRFRTLAVKPVPLSTTNHEEKKKKPLLLSRVKHKRAQVSVACITCRNAKAKVSKALVPVGKRQAALWETVLSLCTIV